MYIQTAYVFEIFQFKVFLKYKNLYGFENQNKKRNQEKIGNHVHSVRHL